MMISALSSATSALQAFPEGIQSVAYNVTNIDRQGHLQTQFVEGSTGQVQGHTEVIAGQTDYARETVNSIIYQRGFEANTITVQAADDMLGTVLDMKV